MREKTPTMDGSSDRRRGARRACAAALLVLLLTACSTAPSARTVTNLPVVDVDYLEERALLLLLADRKTYEGVAVNGALDADAGVRRQLALTLARIGDARGGPVLEMLLGDPSLPVRRAAAFALGELGEQGHREGAPALLGALADPDRETGRLAVEALAKLGVTLETVAARLIEMPPEEFLPRLVPPLYRFRASAVVGWAEQALEQSDPELRAMAAYALAREPREEAAPLLRQLVADGDPRIRGWVARALGRVGDRSDLERLRALLDDPAPGPIIQALRAARRLLAAGAAAPPAEWKPRLLELMADPRPGVRLTAIVASASWLLDEELSTVLVRFATSGMRRERELALIALAEGEEAQAAALVLEAAGAEDPVLRARAAEAAGLLGAVRVLDELASDPSPGVRIAAYETLLAGEPVDAAIIALPALQDADPGVRAAALGWAGEHPVLAMEALLEAMAVEWRDRSADVRVNGVRALLARARAESLERGAIIAELEKLSSDPEYLVRREAVRALGELDREQPALGAVASGRTVRLYREIVQRTARPRRLEIKTERGTLRIELACADAPLTCLNFLQLAGQGFYAGISFHRVVPDFVIQAGDPRGDGWGGVGYAIRDEINPLRYHRGAVGMALSGPDTGGSQFFITLAPQPHLDGGYTVFGRLIGGDEVLDRIVQGDRILEIVEVPAP